MIWLPDDPEMFDLEGWQRRVAQLERMGDDFKDGGAALRMARAEVARLEGRDVERRSIRDILAAFD